MLTLLLLGAAVLAVVLYFLYTRILRPGLQLREALRRLAAGDFRPILMDSRQGIFQDSAIHMRKITEQLRLLDRQITDEGFDLRAILSSMVEGVLITDHALRIRLVNEPLHQMFAIRQSPLQRTIMEVFGHHELQLAIEKALSDGHPQHLALTREESQGGQRLVKHLEVHTGPLQPRGNGRIPGAVVVFHDVTEVKKLEGMRREFVANVSHEFRTPLAVILGTIETLLDGAWDDRPAAEKFLLTMQRNGERLNLLIADLLTLSRMEHRTPELEFQNVEIPQLLPPVLERFGPTIRSTQAVIKTDWDPEATLIRADPARLEQVFSNLLENALRHGGSELQRMRSDGEVFENQIRIKSVPRPNAIEIIFADNGPGIPDADQPHIFERFYRVQKSRSRMAGGTGLGLAIVKHIVQAHGGHVSVSSQPGQGASFSLVLPRHPTPPVQP